MKIEKRKSDTPKPVNGNSTLLSQFAKGNHLKLAKTNNCIIYTRVSTKEQEDGYSLDAQKKECIEFANKNGYNILGYFGGAYESAKTDERREFSRMLQFVKRSKEKVTFIVVHMVDRFSRSGANAIYIKEQLKEVGIYIQSVKQQADTSTSSGDFQQNLQFVFSHYENHVRREKTISGTKEALERGKWVTKPPFGYDMVYVNGEQQITLNDKGKLIQKAFKWKAQGYGTEQIIQKLKPHGFNFYPQKLSRLFRNPFYCGLMSHSVLEGKLLKGKHEACISEEIFLKANEVLKKNSQGYKVKTENEPLPLKNYLKCDHCGSNMPGYIVKKKGLWYYKCRIKGCGNNKSANHLHENYRQLLEKLMVRKDLTEELRISIVNKINQLQAENVAALQPLTDSYKEVQGKLEFLEKRQVFGEITEEIYAKYAEPLREELGKITRKLHEAQRKVSNPEELANKLLKYAQNLRQIWERSHYQEKQKLQYMVFPDGIRYNKKSDECRTTKKDPVFEWIAGQQGNSGGNEKWESSVLSENSHSVPGTRIELVQYCYYWCLRPARLPVPPPGQNLFILICRRVYCSNQHR